MILLRLHIWVLLDLAWIHAVGRRPSYERIRTYILAHITPTWSKSCHPTSQIEESLSLLLRLTRNTHDLLLMTGNRIESFLSFSESSRIRRPGRVNDREWCSRKKGPTPPPPPPRDPTPRIMIWVLNASCEGRLRMYAQYIYIYIFIYFFGGGM